ncbi:MAG: molybdate ABC transporter substrate-binding protein [Pyrinomonadaceae bacterium]|nr:molybdate ABC transporter substrate-binding protein [Pyrinomonadaceae bacterium]
MLLCSQPACLDNSKSEISVAVASNFAATAKEIAMRFENQTGISVRISVGSTGKHFAQISNGAPFDVFLAADSKRPEMLEKNGVAQPNTGFVYAEGQLVFWSADKERFSGTEVDSFLTKNERLAIANPRLAPYGLAAKEALRNLKLEDAQTSKRIVQGENVSQAFHFVASGNAEVGLVAFSQVLTLPKENAGSHWVIPGDLYEPIEQRAVLLSDSKDAKRFLEFLRSPESRELIRRHGYLTP